MSFNKDIKGERRWKKDKILFFIIEDQYSNNKTLYVDINKRKR